MKRFLPLISVLLLLGACSNTAPVDEPLELPIEDEVMEESTEATSGDDFEHFALLSFVADGELSDGLVGATYSEEKGYELFAAIPDLAPLIGDYFYEGWIVRKSPLSVLSTGELIEFQSDWINDFTSEENLLDHVDYIVTLEPNDGDPAPAAHVLEGTFTLIE